MGDCFHDHGDDGGHHNADKQPAANPARNKNAANDKTDDKHESGPGGNGSPSA